MTNSPWRTAFIFSALVGALSGIPARGAAAPELIEQVHSAEQPAGEGIPEVAVARLSALLQSAHELDAWRVVASSLAPALVAARQPDQALQLLSDPRWEKTAAWNFWRGQSLAALKRWDEAIFCFQAARGDYAADADYGLAEAYEATGQPDKALSTLRQLFRVNRWSIRARLRAANILLNRSDWNAAERLLDEINPTATADRKERRILKARVDLARHRPERALPTFESLATKTEGDSHAVVMAALFGAADAHLQLKTPEQGDDFLEDFIEHHPNDPGLPELFAKLDTVYAAERKPSRSELERWARAPEQPRRAFAQWYWARMDMREGHREHALRVFDDLRREGVKAAGLDQAYLEFAGFAAREGQKEKALAMLEEARRQAPPPESWARIDILEGQLLFEAGRFEEATPHLENAAHDSSPIGLAAKYDASLGWLEMGNQTRFLEDLTEMKKAGADPDSVVDLELSKGLLEARKGAKTAAETLRAFIRAHPNARRLSEAWVALAELAFHATPPQLDEARRALQRASESKPTPAAQEEADYLAIWIEDASAGPAGTIIDLARKFLAQHPTSSFATDVRMKLAETYFREQDFANAQTHFEIIAGQAPSGPLAERALFFAAQSAMSTMGAHALDRAIELFDSVAQMKGDMRWAARNEEALIERRLNKAHNALLLYDEVLQGDARPPEKREALCGKGDIYFELTSEDPKNMDKAIECYDQLATQSSPDGHWHNQALFKKGVCLEKKSDRAGALSVFYSVIEEQARPGRTPEFFWFYKAGFNAARLLEEGAKWPSAAAIYEKLVAAGGTRSEEAKARLDKLRLEHFLWSD